MHYRTVFFLCVGGDEGQEGMVPLPFFFSINQYTFKRILYFN